jgi:hypothetical protein
LPPDIQEHFADEVFGGGSVADEPQNESVDAHMVPREQHLHRKPIATGDPSDQNFI